MMDTCVLSLLPFASLPPLQMNQSITQMIASLHHPKSCGLLRPHLLFLGAHCHHSLGDGTQNLQHKVHQSSGAHQDPFCGSALQAGGMGAQADVLLSWRLSGMGRHGWTQLLTPNDCYQGLGFSSLPHSAFSAPLP